MVIPAGLFATALIGQSQTVNATFSDTVVDRIRRRASTVVVFSEAIDVSSFQTTDLTVTRSAGVDFTVGTRGRVTATSFGLSWTLPPGSGNASITAFPGTVTVGGVERTVNAVGLPESFTFQSAPPADAITAIVRSPVVDNTARRASFPVTAITGITNFDSNDVSLTGDTTGVRVSVQGSADSADWQIILSNLPANSQGSISVEISGTVTVSGTSRTIVSRPSTASFNTAANAPRNLRISPLGVGGLRVQWNPRSDVVDDGSADIYTIEWREGTSGDFTSATIVVPSHTQNIVHDITGLKNDTLYQVRVTDGSNGTSVTGTGRTAVPETPTIPPGTPTITAVLSTIPETPVSNYSLIIAFEGDRSIGNFFHSDIQQSGEEVVLQPVRRIDNTTFLISITSSHTSGSTTFSFPDDALINVANRLFGSGDTVHLIIGTPLVVSYAEPIIATITAPSPLPVASLTASAVCRFSEVVANFETDDVAVRSDLEGHITINSITAYTGDDARTGQDYFINFSVDTNVSGSFDLGFEIQHSVTVDGKSRTVTGNLVTITYDTLNILPVNATITPPTLPVRSRMASSIVRFDAVVSDFTLSDLVKSGDPDENITLNSITAYTGDDARTGQDYFVNYSIAMDKAGSFQLGFADDAKVTVNSQSVGILVGSVQPITYDTRSALSATFGTGVVDAIARTVTVRCTFARAIDVSSFTTSDLQVGLPQGVSLVSVAISQVNSGSTDTAFDIVFTLPEDVTGSISYDIQGRVTENSVSRLVLISEASTEFTTFPSTISPTMKNHEGTKTGDFSVEVNFLNAGVSGFGTDDISIGLSGVVASVVPLGSGVYRIDFTGLPTEMNGTFALDLIGSVQVAMSGSRSITFAPVTITYDTRQPVSGRWEGVEGVKTSAINIDFYLATTETITNFEASDFTLTYVSGDTLDTAGISIAAFFQLGVQGSETQFSFIFAPFASGVSGVFQIAVTGRATVGGVDKAVSAPTVQIAYNTTATATTPGRALFVISPAERPIGVLADEPINDTVSFDIVCDQETRISNVNEFTIADIRIHESTATGVKTPLVSALRNVGTLGTHTHYRLAYTPVANSQGSVYIEVVEDALPDIKNLPAYSVPVDFNTRPPRIPPEPIWAIPDGIVSDSTAPFDVDLNFGENVIGLTIGDFIIEGIENHTTLLYKVIDDVESLHSDNTPASIFRLKIIPRARQIGTMSIILLRDAVTAVDDTTPGPESNSQSPPIQYDTVPMPEPDPEPLEAAWTAFPVSISEAGAEQTFEITFSRDVRGFNSSDIDVFGVRNYLSLIYKVINDVESPHIDDTPASVFRVKVQINANQNGIIWLSLKGRSVTASNDGGTGPPVSVTSPGVPYDTRTPEPPETPTPDILSVVMPKGIQTAPFDAVVTFDREVVGVSVNAFRVIGPTGTTIQSVTRVTNTNAYIVRIVPPANVPLSLITLRLVGGVVDSA